MSKDLEVFQGYRNVIGRIMPIRVHVVVNDLMIQVSMTAILGATGEHYGCVVINHGMGHKYSRDSALVSKFRLNPSSNS